MVKRPLSYTAMNKYLSCPREYKYHYVDRLRSSLVGSSLIFGNAVDQAITHLLRHRNLNQAISVFEDSFATYTDNQGNVHVTSTYKHIAYLKNDTDIELLTDEEAKNVADGVYPLPWICLVAKGRLIVRGFYNHVLPRVKRVIALQEDVTLVNEAGEQVTGKVDAVVEWSDGRIIVFDAKTSSMPYEPDSVELSEQLSIYYPACQEKYKATAAGYWVAIKNINKNKKKRCVKCGYDGTGGTHQTCPNSKPRCHGEWEIETDPKAYVQILIGEPSNHFQELVHENLDEVNRGINAEAFPRLLANCIRPWGKCAYYDLCHGGDTKNLVKV